MAISSVVINNKVVQKHQLEALDWLLLPLLLLLWVINYYYHYYCYYGLLLPLLLLLCLCQSRYLCTRYSENKWTNFDENWHKWFVGQGHEIINGSWGRGMKQ